MVPARISAGRFLAFLVLFLASVMLIAGCSLPWKHAANANASSGATHAPKPTTKQLLASLQKSFRAVTAIHVVLQVQNPGPVSQDDVQIRNASGDVIMPDKVQGHATVILSRQTVTIKLISIRNNQYISEPITGQWRVLPRVLD